MIIDTLASMPAPQDGDIKMKKRDEVEEFKPIQESEESNNPELDFNKEENVKVRTGDEFNGPDKKEDLGKDIYNASGKLLRDIIKSEQDFNDKKLNMDMIV